MNLTFAIKNYVERKIILRGSSLLHPLEKLDRSVEVLRKWLLDRLHVVGVEIVLIWGTDFLLTPITQSLPRRTMNSLRVWRGRSPKLRRLWCPFLTASSFGTIPLDGDGFSEWFSQLHCRHLSDICLPTARMLVGPSPATWTNPC